MEPFRFRANAVLAVAMALLAAGQLRADEIGLTVLGSLERIGQFETPHGSAQAEISAAGNEVTSFQIVVSARGQAATVTDAYSSDLVSGAQTISQTHLALFREEYVRVRISSPRAALPPGLYPDALVPFINPVTGHPIPPRNQYREKPSGKLINSGYEIFAAPFNLWAGENQPLWIDVTVPPNTPAGRYAGSITLVTADGAKHAVPVSLKVRGFSLPAGPALATNFGPFRNILSSFGADPASARGRAIELEYCRTFAANRISPPVPASLLPEAQPDGTLAIDRAKDAALRQFVENFSVTQFEVPMPNAARARAIDAAAVERYFKSYSAFLRDRPWLRRPYAYMLDEPNTKEAYEKVLVLGDILHRAAPAIRRLVVEQPYLQDPAWPALDGAVDIWCPLFSFIDEDAVRAKKAQGSEVWSYTALTQRAPAYHPHYAEVKNWDPPYWQIDQPLGAYRVASWIDWRYKITGLLYWSAVTTVIDAWLCPELSHTGGKHWAGEGYLLYPGAPAGVDGPIASLRLKSIRDGLQDYDYCSLLAKLAGSAAVDRIVASVAPNWGAATAGAAHIPEARDKLAEAIESALAHPVARADARQVLWQAAERAEGWPRIHACEALIALGEGTQVHGLLLKDLDRTGQSAVRTGIWRALAMTSPTPIEKERWLARIREVLSEPIAPDRAQALESLCKAGDVALAGAATAERTAAAALSPADRLYLIWQEWLRAEPGAAVHFRAALRSPDPEVRRRAAYILRRLPAPGPATVTDVEQAATAEPIGTPARSYLVMAALSLAPEAPESAAWQVELEGLLWSPATAVNVRGEILQVLVPRFDAGEQSRLAALLENPSGDLAIAAAWALIRAERNGVGVERVVPNALSDADRGPTSSALGTTRSTRAQDGTL